jgi:hypothetical protein
MVKGRWLMIELGDPADDLIVATIIFLVDGKLVLLRPRRVSLSSIFKGEELTYDRQQTTKSDTTCNS